MKRSRTDETNLCAYCGKLAITEDAHIFSKALFPKPLPDDLITVPGCQECNHRLSKYEGEFRDFLVLDIRTNRHPSAVKLRDGKVRRSTMRNSSKVGRAFLSSKETCPLVTPGGIYLGEQPVLRVRDDWVRYVLQMMVRAAHYHHFQQVIPENWTVKVHLYNSQELDIAIAIPEAWGLQWNKPFSMGKDEVNWSYVRWGEDDFKPTMWAFSFYDAFYVAANVIPNPQRIWSSEPHLSV